MFTTSIQPRTQAELLSLANEMAQRISGDNRDWTRFKFTNIYTGDGVKTAWDLPADYRRMPITANVWKGTSPLRFIPDADEWLQRRINNLSSSPGWGEWTIYGGQMHIFPALAVGEPVGFVYISRNCVALNGGGFGDTFTNDGDRFALDERLLKLGMTWEWKCRKGSPYAEDMGTYSDALVTGDGQ